MENGWVTDGGWMDGFFPAGPHPGTLLCILWDKSGQQTPPEASGRSVFCCTFCIVVIALKAQCLHVCVNLEILTVC